jgi:hypothetical protein
MAHPSALLVVALEYDTTHSLCFVERCLFHGRMTAIPFVVTPVNR